MEASAEDLAERHCSVAESLEMLGPDRTKPAISHYDVALELDPQNVRAREGVERLSNKARRG